MYSVLKAFLVLMKLLSLSKFYARKITICIFLDVYNVYKPSKQNFALV